MAKSRNKSEKSIKRRENSRKRLSLIDSIVVARLSLRGTAFSTFNLGEDMFRRLPHPGCALIGLLFMTLVLFMGFYMFSVSQGLIFSGVSTTGIVTLYRGPSDCGQDGGGHGGDDYYVRFTTSAGREIDIDEEAPGCSNTYRVGERVPVLYNPDNPYEAKVANFYDLWEMPLLTIIFGFVGCWSFGGATTVFIRQRRQRKKSLNDQAV